LPLSMAVLVASGRKMAGYAGIERAPEPAPIFVAVQYICWCFLDSTGCI
jgi:hypothetical protein